jgi:hypothetical protein
MDTQHLKAKTKELQQNASEQKTGFIQKEQDFIKNLKNVQEKHI